MSKQMLELAKGLREAAHYCTELSELEKHCNDIAGKLDSMARQCSAASAQPANEPTDLYSYVPDIVKNAMLTMWNYICDDSKCHPLDIEHGRGKVLTFEPKHWAQFTGEMVQRNIRDLFAGAEPQTAPDEAVADQIVGQIEERFPDWRSYRDLIDCIDCTLHRLRADAYSQAGIEK